MDKIMRSEKLYIRRNEYQGDEFRNDIFEGCRCKVCGAPLVDSDNDEYCNQHFYGIDENYD